MVCGVGCSVCGAVTNGVVRRAVRWSVVVLCGSGRGYVWWWRGVM